MTGLSLFPRRKPPRQSVKLNDLTLSGFDGGLDLTANDLTLSPRFSKVLDNVVQGTDGGLAIRWGTKLFVDVSSVVDGDLLEIVYFNGSLIAFTDEGEIARVEEDGTKTAIWNSAIAALLTGAPDGWTPGTFYVDTAEFKGSLVAVNGEDKPITISSSFTVDYLQDLATGSNVNTPIGKYVTTVSNYLIIGGVTGALGSIYISSSGTAGVFPGDDAPNDSLSYNLSSFVAENSNNIIGLSSFRNSLVVAFEGAIVVVELGTYDDNGNHTPKVQDNIVEHGVINFRTMITADRDLIMSDIAGWHIATKNTFGLVDTKSISHLLDPHFSGSINLEEDERAKAFSVYNKLERRITTFVIDRDGATVGWTASAGRRSFSKPAYTRFLGMSFDCGCGTARGRVFFGKGSKIYQYGNDAYENEDYTGDLIGQFDDNWSSGIVYSVGTVLKNGDDLYQVIVAHTSSVLLNDLEDGNLRDVTNGQYIDVDWELPWVDMNSRSRKKRLSYIQVDTAGSAQFTVQLYVDNFYKDVNEVYDPAVALDFVGGDSQGYGNGDQPYGGGRRTKDERPWKIPVDFKILKMRLIASTNKPLSIVALTLMYIIGTYRR